jgi:hypothetical protein
LRASFASTAVLLGLVSLSVVGAPEERGLVRFPRIGGHSGKLLAFIENREGLQELQRAGLEETLEEPGVYPLHWPKSWPESGRAAGASIILLTPFSEKREGRIGSYVLGSWPNEGEAQKGSPAAKYAATQSSYALPPGFIKVTRSTVTARVSEHFRVGDFLTKDQPNVWPKYLVLDLKLVDKLELLIDALRHAGHPVVGLHVMSGFRTPAYNAKEVGPGNRSAISRHQYGDGADVYPDEDGDGQIDDLNGDGHRDLADARIVADAAESVEKKYPDLAGGIGVYPATAAHGPVVHVDVRGKRARW